VTNRAARRAAERNRETKPATRAAEPTRNGTHPTHNEPTHNDAPTTSPPTGPLDVTHIDTQFWDARDSLTHIRDAALARMCAPWAVLGYTAARALALIPPNVTLPPLIGGPGSLNWFACIVALSGGGKGAARAVATELTPATIYTLTPGSGEGICRHYYTPAAGNKPATRRESIMFDSPEIDSVAALTGRNGSNLMPVIRQGFSGEQLGFAYADPTKAGHVPAHDYRMTWVIGVQPGRAAALLNDGDGGTPQRFMWFPATDPRITATGYSNHTITPLTLPPPETWRYPTQLTVPNTTRDTIIGEHAKRQHGGEALDGHALFCREKFAYALALLDNRPQMNEQDWELAGTAAQVSTHIRTAVTEILTESQRTEAAEQGALRGVWAEAADHEKNIATTERIQRVLRRIIKLLDAHGGALKAREITQKIAHRDRPSIPAALNLGSNSGQIELLDDNVTWRKI
jgi:hypothetical protein